MSRGRALAWNLPEHVTHVERAQRLSRRELGLVRRGDRGLLGIAVAGEVVAHAVLDAEALQALSERAAAIAGEIGGGTRVA